MIASAVLAAAGPDELKHRLLPGLADGSLIGAVALGGDVTAGRRNGQRRRPASCSAGISLNVLLVVQRATTYWSSRPPRAACARKVPANLDTSRRAAKITLDEAPAIVLAGARRLLTDLARIVLAAEAAGIAAEVTQMASEYAKVRSQFGRPIATFQAVKHHCANMLVAAELATCAAWDAGRAAATGGDQLSFTAAMAAVLAIPAAASNAQLNIQVHGGIGFTWEHDAHLFLRRAAAVAALVDTEQAAVEITDLVRAGVRRAAAIDLPPEAEPIRAAIGPDVAAAARAGR